MKHPSDSNLALLAGGDLSFFSRFRAARHLRNCGSCRERVQEFDGIRRQLSYARAEDARAEMDVPDVSWNSLAAEMRANIRLGLEAGACVRSAPEIRRFNPRLTVAFASLCLLAASGVFLNTHPARQPKPETNLAILAATGGRLELRTGANSLTLLNHHGAMADQTVGAEGEIRARYVDSETGSVTINNVYLEE